MGARVGSARTDIGVVYFRERPRGRSRLQVTIRIGKAPSGREFRTDEEHIAMQNFLHALHELQKVHARLNS
jgi:hypothetical protein